MRIHAQLFLACSFALVAQAAAGQTPVRPTRERIEQCVKDTPLGPVHEYLIRLTACEYQTDEAHAAGIVALETKLGNKLQKRFTDAYKAVDSMCDSGRLVCLERIP
jgi:hypothetical protein